MPFTPGKSGNPYGRPRKGESIAAKFRRNPKIEIIIKQVFEVAETFGTDHQHADAWVATKLVLDKIIPTLKRQEFEQTDVSTIIADLMERISRSGEEAYETAMKSNKDMEKWRENNMERKNRIV